MGRWTSWKKLAAPDGWYSWDEHERRPACYELGLGGPRRCSSPDVVYVGETGNLKQRLSVHASHVRDNIWNHVRRQLKQNRGIYFRAYFCRSRAAAKRKQDSLLEKYYYDWNTQRNPE